MSLRLGSRGSLILSGSALAGFVVAAACSSSSTGTRAGHGDDGGGSSSGTGSSGAPAAAARAAAAELQLGRQQRRRAAAGEQQRRQRGSSSGTVPDGGCPVQTNITSSACTSLLRHLARRRRERQRARRPRGRHWLLDNLARSTHRDGRHRCSPEPRKSCGTNLPDIVLERGQAARVARRARSAARSCVQSHAPDHTFDKITRRSRRRGTPAAGTRATCSARHGSGLLGLKDRAGTPHVTSHCDHRRVAAPRTARTNWLGRAWRPVHRRATSPTTTARQARHHREPPRARRHLHGACSYTTRRPPSAWSLPPLADKVYIVSRNEIAHQRDAHGTTATRGRAPRRSRSSTTTSSAATSTGRRRVHERAGLLPRSEPHHLHRPSNAFGSQLADTGTADVNQSRRTHGPTCAMVRRSCRKSRSRGAPPLPAAELRLARG